jgi:hypothetical protein
MAWMKNARETLEELVRQHLGIDHYSSKHCAHEGCEKWRLRYVETDLCTFHAEAGVKEANSKVRARMENFIVEAVMERMALENARDRERIIRHAL